MKRFKLVLVGLVVVSFSALLFKSCTNEMMDQQEEGLSVLPATRSVENIVYCGEVKTVALLAGQHIDAGTVVVGNGMCVITAALQGTTAFTYEPGIVASCCMLSSF